MDPYASRETLDHSIMYIFAVALEDGSWDHVKSYTPQRARRKSTIKLWHKISTREDKKWTRKYHDQNPKKKCFGGKVIVRMKDGSIISEEINVADAHPSGKRPFKRKQYIEKFKSLTEGIISHKESDRFLKIVQNLKKLKSRDILGLNIKIGPKVLRKNRIRANNLSIF
tara:strand:- start:194 stop:700 length:507 start_codon:yes stop_codon:yes gene_type:complete